MRLTFLYTSLTLCALCPAFPLSTRDCQATTLHPRGAPIRPSGPWLPTPGRSSFLPRLQVGFKHFAREQIPCAHRKAIKANIRQYHDNLSRNPGEISSVRGARLAVVQNDGLSISPMCSTYSDSMGSHIYHLRVKHYARPTNPYDSGRGLHLGDQRISTYIPHSWHRTILRSAK